MKIISGGQTGVDRAALDAAIEIGLPYGGTIPQGRVSEDGGVPLTYTHLKEATRSEYSYRTEQNVIHSDAILILTYLPMVGGTKLTEIFCKKYAKIHLIIDLQKPETENKEKVLKWLFKVKPEVLNIAGPRESKHPGIYQKTKTLLEKIFKTL